MFFLSRLFPGFRTVRRTLNTKRPAHFRLFGSVLAEKPQPFVDLPRAEMEQINRKSEEYFQRSSLKEFWMNKPFSDPAWAGWILTRLGHLLSALDLNAGDRVLDFGCGTGWTSIMLTKMGLNVVGMDISPAALKIAEECAQRDLSEQERLHLKFDAFAGEKIPYPDHEFDAILVFEAFHHLPNPQKILREFFRVLAPNSRFGFAEPGIGHEEGEHSKEEMEEGVLERELDLEQLYQSGIQAGFQGMELLVPGLHPHAVTLPMRRTRWYLRGLSWLVPADYFRLGILCSPLGLFWKGPHFVSSLHPRAHSASIKPATGKMECQPDSQFELVAHVENTGGTVWLKEGRRGRGYVRLGAHLLDQNEQILEPDYGRAGLSNDMRENETAGLTLTLRAPAREGSYIIRLDMVNEGIGWFAEKGSKTPDVQLLVQNTKSQ